MRQKPGHIGTDFVTGSNGATPYESNNSAFMTPAGSFFKGKTRRLIH